MIRRPYLFIMIAAGVLVTAAAAFRPTAHTGWPKLDDSKQLKFSHKTHVDGAGINCETCHPKATLSKDVNDDLRSIHDNCTSCHEEQLNNQCDFCHKDPENIQAAAPHLREIKFSHELHLKKKGTQCTTCHPGLDKADYAGPANMPEMATCSTCHNDRQASNACEACHTQVTALIPPDHLEAGFKKDHKNLTRLGAMETNCATCHTQNFCGECHTPGAVMQFGSGAMMSDPNPRVFPGTSSTQMTLQRAHDLNYRFTHGVDAKSKSSECYTCHAAREFCGECHEAGDNVTSHGFKPASHLGAGFATFGVGSGGGRHAELARRDIETCVSCHDTQGGDPTCITCHADGDGIRGTDPRTHPSGYMRNEHGPWHENAGAACFNCHTDMNAHPGGTKGRNFCGYCHG
jgi:c(7)-type cytochrome triheme protein